MTLGEKLKLLRAEIGWSQKDLAKKINADQAQISGYERGEAIPSAAILKRIAIAFNVTTDYILFDENDEKASAKIKDKELLNLFEEVQKINDADKEVIKKLIEIAIVKNRMQSAAEYQLRS